MPLKLTTYYQSKDIPELPGTNIFHSKELFLLYEAASGYEPIYIVATLDEKPVAKLLAVIRRQTHLIPASWGKRCEIYGTGEFLNDDQDNERIFGDMLEHLTNEAERRSIIIEFRNLRHTMDGYRYFRANHYFSINWLCVRNSLHSRDTVEERFDQSRIRQVKKAIANGAEVCQATTDEEIREFSRMLHKIYSFRMRKYFPSQTFFALINEYLITKGRARIYVVKYKGRIIGGSSVLLSANDAYLWFSGGMTKIYAKLFPGVLAVWAALKDTKENGYSHLEFVDVGLPFQKHGFRTFVLAFGGKQSGTRRWFRVRWNFMNRIMRWLYA